MVNNKLIRLHSEDEFGVFDCIFNDEILISPKSEIALQSCNISRSLESLVIDATNDKLKYQITATQGLRELKMKHGTYTRNNILTLFQDIQDKINNKLDIDDTKNNGTQFNLSIDNDERTFFEFRYSPLFNWVRSANSSGIEKNEVNTASLELKRNVATASQNLLDSYIYGKVPFIKGCGVFRCRIKQMTNQANGGFIMGLIDKENYPKIAEGTLTEAEIYLGIKVPANPADNLEFIKEGTAEDSGETLRRFSAGGGSDNDILEIQLDQKDFYPVLHTTDAGDVNISESVVLDDGDPLSYDNEKEYYCFISLFSGSNNLRLSRCGHMPDPFEQSPADLDLNEFEAENAITAPNPPSFNKQATTYNLIFETFGIADYLGFRNVEQNRNANTTNEGLFKANRSLKNIVVSDSYLIELLNLPLNSYDSLSQGRKNILASIPISERVLTNTGLIQYEPHSPFYINLNNDFPISLRNIKARITTDDFQQIILEGLSTISIIVRDSE
jgi:hypothetical protein